MTGIPASCYDQCTDAYNRALSASLGPEFCAGSFLQDLQKCIACSQVASSNATFAIPEFDQFFGYCSNLSNGAITSLGQLASELASLSQAIQSLTNKPLTSSTSLYSNSSTSSITGHSAPVLITGYSTPISTPISPPPDTSTPSRAWIAGAVIGSLTALVLLIALTIFIYSRKRQRRAVSELSADASEVRAHPDHETCERPQRGFDSLQPTGPFELQGSLRSTLEAEPLRDPREEENDDRDKAGIKEKDVRRKPIPGVKKESENHVIVEQADPRGGAEENVEQDADV